MPKIIASGRAPRTTSEVPLQLVYLARYCRGKEATEAGIDRGNGKSTLLHLIEPFCEDELSGKRAERNR
jgi:hypothetical protein